MCCFMTFYLDTSMWVLTIISAICLISPSETRASDLIEGISTFAKELYRNAAQSESGNVIVSPFAVAMALSLLSQATNETVFDQIKQVLHFDGDKSAMADQFHEYYKLIQKSAGPTDLRISNQIYYFNQADQLVLDFKDSANRTFGLNVMSAEYKKPNDTEEAINHFAQEVTNESINELVKTDLVKSNSSIVMENEIFFKGRWVQNFEPASTGKYKFFTNETHTVDNEIMGIKQYFWYKRLDLDADLLRLDYAHSNLSFVIIRPKSRIGLSTLEESLYNHSLADIINGTKSNRQMRIRIPRFKIESEFQLRKIFKNMGMAKMFDLGSNVSDLLKEFVRVTDVICNAAIEINEEYTEVPGITGRPLRTLVNSGVEFTVNRPFIFHVWDKTTKTAIISGRIKTFEGKNLLKPFVRPKYTPWNKGQSIQK